LNNKNKISLGFNEHMVVAVVARNSFKYFCRGFIREIKKDKKEADPMNNHSKEHNRLSAKLVASIAKYTKQEASYE